MKTLVFAAALCAFASAAPAQDNQPSPQDIAAIDQCVAAAARTGSAAQTIDACVGLLSANCPDQTTLGLVECIQREHGAWDAWLNAWWKPMKTRAKAAGDWPRLLASQRRWISDRDSECRRAYEAGEDGSIRYIWAAECQRDLTARRAVEFYYTLYK